MNESPVDKKVPVCIGIIMDGNRRWAKSKGLPTLEGHRRGYDRLKDVVRWAGEAGGTHLVIYAFSTENWKRTKEEVGYLMDLFRWVLKEEVAHFIKEEVKVTAIGDTTSLPPDIQEGIRAVEEKTKQFSKLHVVLALSYGGRKEILAATKAIVAKGFSGADITEEDFQKNLWTHDIPDPDMVIRTGGERRLSNFLPWQSVYSELFFSDTYWPEFTKEEFQNILNEYSERERRHGK